MISPGTQIIYVPGPAAGDVHHPDTEADFITSVRGDVAFCRYWSKVNPGELRTQANSEGTPIDMLVVQDTCPQDVVDALLAQIDDEHVSACIAEATRRNTAVRVELYKGKVITYVPAGVPFFGILHTVQKHPTLKAAREWVDSTEGARP